MGGTPTIELTRRTRAGAFRVGVAAGLAALAFVAARTATYDGDITALIRIGEGHADAELVPEGLHVFEGSDGYDGQYYYRIARSPLSLEDRVDGIDLDRPAYRNARIGYPLAAWVLSLGGMFALVPWALAAINIVAVGVIGALGARFAESSGRSPWLGLVFAAWPGLIVGLAYDLAEPLEGAFLLATLLLLRRGRDGLAATTLAVAVITRETALLLAVAVAAVRLAGIIGRRMSRDLPRWVPTAERPVSWLVPVLPAVTYAGVQAVMAARWGRAATEAASLSAGAISAPFVALGRQFATWVGDGGLVDVYQLLQVAVMVVLVIALVRSLGDPGAGMSWERMAFAAALLAVVSLPGWDRAVVYLRYPNDLIAFGLVVHLGATPGPLPSWARTGVIIKAAVFLAVTTAIVWVAV